MSDVDNPFMQENNRTSFGSLVGDLEDSFPLDNTESRNSIADLGKVLFSNHPAPSLPKHQQSNISSKVPVSEPPMHSNPMSTINTIVPPPSSSGTNPYNNEVNSAKRNRPTFSDSFGLNSGVSQPPVPSRTQYNPSSNTSSMPVEFKGIPRQKTNVNRYRAYSEVSNTAANNSTTESTGPATKLLKKKATPKRWNNEEDNALRAAVKTHGERNWKAIADNVPGRNHTQCLQRWTKVLAPGLVKGHWRSDEDDMLRQLVAEGRKNWGQVATRIPGRTSKQCRERWYNHLDPGIIRGEYSPEEDQLIIDAQKRLGNRWSAISAMLPGRTEDAVKIRWKSLCRSKSGKTKQAAVAAAASGQQNNLQARKKAEQQQFQARNYNMHMQQHGKAPFSMPHQMGINNNSGGANGSHSSIGGPAAAFANHPSSVPSVFQPAASHHYQQHRSTVDAHINHLLGPASPRGTTIPSSAMHQPPPITGRTAPPAETTASSSTGGGAFSNPAANFAISLQGVNSSQKPGTTTSTQPPHGANTKSGFNPAAAFAQNLQTGGMASGQKNNSRQGSEAQGIKKQLSPPSSLTMPPPPAYINDKEKTKSRLSIDLAARASFNRRSQSGRTSIEGFLHALGDVGRISDIELADLSNIDDVWRMSDDMNRLSL